MKRSLRARVLSLIAAVLVAVPLAGVTFPLPGPSPIV
jgi:hypothetical protein